MKPRKVMQLTGRTPRVPNPRGCPGSYSRVARDENGRGVCPFCNNDFRVSETTGLLRAHVRH